MSMFCLRHYLDNTPPAEYDSFVNSRAGSALPAPAHPIQVVARRTGLSADVIRAWEKRYQVVAPVRSATGRRVYSDADIERLRLLSRATISGRTIGQVAGLSPAALATLVRTDFATSLRRPAVDSISTDGAAASGETRATSAVAENPALEHVASCLDAVERFDVVDLDSALRRGSLALSAESFLDSLVVPFWNVLAEGVSSGKLRTAHEHLALAALRRALNRVVDTAVSAVAQPDLVVTTPLGQPQELGALLVAAVAAADGWRPIYVGPGLPAEAIAETAARLGAQAVTLSLDTATSDRVVPRELRRLRELLPVGIELIVEGTAADAHRGVLREIDAVVLRTPTALRARLRALRSRK